MPYLGVAPNPRENREVDDISGSFNGSTTAFTLQSGGSNVSPGKDTAIIVSLGGVVQNPGTDYTIAASTITFTTAPASGLTFFGVVLAQSIDINTPADGTVTTAKIVNDAVTADKLAHTSVTAGSYTTADITVDAQGRITAAANGTIAEAEIANNAVTTNKIANDAVTFSKMQDTANGVRFLGKHDSGGGEIGEITAAQARTMINVADGANQTTINNNADNGVITGSGTANTLEGEANLVFNGNELSISHTNPQFKLTDTTNNTDAFLFSDDNGSIRLAADLNSEASDSRIRMSTDGVERVSIAEHLTISNGDLVIGTDGHGIDFSAQTAASNAYTKDSELLDHYEEGTFTPNISSPQLNSCQLPAFTDASYAARNGNYIKIGRLVMFVVEIQMHASTRVFANGDGTQNLAIMGAFPFARATSSYPRKSPCTIRFEGNSTFNNLNLYATATNHFPPPFIQVSKTAGTGLTDLSINDVFQTSSHVHISGFYLADA